MYAQLHVVRPGRTVVFLILFDPTVQMGRNRIVS